VTSLRCAEVDYALDVPEVTGDGIGGDVKDGSDLVRSQKFSKRGRYQFLFVHERKYCFNRRDPKYRSED
jgi:hypothetical protein